MVLDTYFTAKSRLEAALPALRALGGRARGGTGTDLKTCVRMIEELRELFCVVVAGVPGCGKSALINALKAETGNRLRFDILVIQGADSYTSHRSAMERADAIVCVLDAVEPWRGAMWDFLAALPEAVSEKSLVVVQRCDLRDSAELAPVLRHMAEEMRRRVGDARTIVAVSARYAELARGESENRGSLRDDSGIVELCQALSGTLEISTDCHATLELAAHAGTSALEAMRNEIGDVAAGMEVTDAVRHDVEQLSERLLAQTSGQLGPVLTSVDRGFMDAVIAAEKQWSAAPARLSTTEADAIATQLQAGLQKAIANTIIRALNEAASLLEHHLDRSWGHIVEHLKQRHGGAFRADDFKQASWQGPRRAFLDAGARRTASARKAVRVDEDASRQLSRPASLRRTALSCVLLLAMGAGVALYGEQWIVAGICAAAIPIPLLAYARWLKRWRKRSARAFWDALDSHRMRLEQAMADVIKLDTEGYHAEFRGRVAGLSGQAERLSKKQAPVLSEFEAARRAMAEAEIRG